METIKIFETKHGDKFVKMQIVLEIPIDNTIVEITKRKCIDSLFEMERVDLGEMVLNESGNSIIILESDNI